MKNTLHLNLKRKWFDMILSGEKKEEYRYLKPYWEKRFCCSYSDFEIHGVKSSIYSSFYPILNNCFMYETVTFSNGYSKTRDQFEIEFKGFEVREGNTEWGAEEGKKYFVLKLGKILSVNTIYKSNDSK